MQQFAHTSTVKRVPIRIPQRTRDALRFARNNTKDFIKAKLGMTNKVSNPKPDYVEKIEDDNIILSERAELQMSKIPDPALERNKHVYVLGGSGSGKTFNFVGPNLLQLNSSIVTTDPKGDTLKQYGNIFLRHGYKLKVVNTKPDQINQSMHYNPLLYLQDSTSIMQIVNLLVENTSGNAEAEKEDFFVKAERQLYMALMGYLFYFYADQPQYQTFPQMLDLLQLAGKDNPSQTKTPLDIIMLGTTAEDGFQVHPTMKSVEFGLLKALAGGTLDCGESGSTLRFMLPVACALGAEATFVGQGRLGARPLSPLSDEIIAAGCDLQGLGGFPLKTSGRMRPGTFILPGNVSSQYISGLLLAAPLLAQPSCVQVTGLIESRPYINLTIQAMKAFGVEVNVERIPAKDGQPEITNFRVSSGSYRTPGNVAVEGDWSNAAFWLCAGAIGTDPITVEGVSLSSAQGDRNVLAALSRFGARIVRSTNAATVQSDKLAGFEMSAHDIPDLVPVISAVASLAQGRTFIRDCARLRIKESDRLATTTRELTALGAQVRIAGDDLIIKGVDAFTGGEVDSHNDHRIAMMAAIAASRATGEVVIHGAEAVNKSYPDFFDHYRLLGGNVTLEEE